MKQEQQSKINGVIKQREKMSELVSNSFHQMIEKPKEKFIEKTLLEKSFVSELGQRSDPIYKKAKNCYLDKEYLQQKYLNKYVFNEKPGVKDFYEKYVEYILLII